MKVTVYYTTVVRTADYEVDNKFLKLEEVSKALNEKELYEITKEEATFEEDLQAQLIENVASQIKTILGHNPLDICIFNRNETVLLAEAIKEE